MSLPMIPVCAAVIFRDGKVLVTSRPEGKPWAGYWEFPGGKIEAGETHEACLVRELHEELGVNIVVHDLLMKQTFAYPEKIVELFFYRCEMTAGAELEMREGQSAQWLHPTAMDPAVFLPADVAIVAYLQRKVDSLT